MKDWNSIYAAKGIFQKKPSVRVLQAIALFKQNGFNRVLDLGCGTGRHTRSLIDHGFEVNACDSSYEALLMARRLIPEAHFARCDMTSLPYQDGLFDGIICNHVIQHGKMADIRQAVLEMKRVLNAGACLLLIAASTQHPKCATGREIEPNTKIHTDAVDGHIPHHFFTEEELKTLFQNFEILKLKHFKGPSELDCNQESAGWELLARSERK